jgi:hypothetical protein
VTLSTTFFDDRYSYRERPLDALDYTLFLSGIWLVCGLGVGLRFIGPFFMVIPVGICLIYALSRLTVSPRVLSVYLVYCAFIAVLSTFRMLPTSWQTHFMSEAIVRQLVPMSAFFAVAWAAKAYFRRRIYSGDAFYDARTILLLSLVVAPILMFQLDRVYQNSTIASSIIGSFGSFVNNNTIAMFYILAIIFLMHGLGRYIGLTYVIVVAATTHFAQFKVLAVAVLVTLFGVSGRLTAIMTMIIISTLYASAIYLDPNGSLLLPNWGLRLEFVSDAISSVIDTYGVGVGFGTESVKWRYSLPGGEVFAFLPDPKLMTPDNMIEALSTGVENSFVQALLRTGVLGFVLFVTAILCAFPPQQLPRKVRDHAALCFCMIFIACFVNSCLESPLSAVGVGFVYGYLLALRAWACRLKRNGALRWPDERQRSLAA